MSFDNLLRRCPKSNDEFVLVLAMMRVSTLPEYAAYTASEIYDMLLGTAKQSSEYKAQQEMLASAKRFEEAMTNAKSPEEKHKVWVTDFSGKE